MLLVMSVVTILGTGVAIVATLAIRHRCAVLCRVARAKMDREVNEMTKRGKTLDARLCDEVMSGGDCDRAIEEFANARTGILCLTGSESPWLWNPGDLEKWGDEELAIQVSAHHRKARLIAFSTLTAIILLVLAVDVILYGQATASQPIVSPQEPASFQPIPAPTEAVRSNPSNTSLTPVP